MKDAFPANYFSSWTSPVYESQINEVVAADFGIRFLVCACFNTGSAFLSAKDDGRYR